jgi:hypothetical protein
MQMAAVMAAKFRAKPPKGARIMLAAPVQPMMGDMGTEE